MLTGCSMCRSRTGLFWCPYYGWVLWWIIGGFLWFRNIPFEGVTQVGQEGTAGGHMHGPGLYAGPTQGRWGWLTGGTYTRVPTGCGLCHFVWSGVLVPGGVCLTQRDDPDLPR